MRKNQKKLWQSKTLWIAVIQGVIGVMAVIIADNPYPEAMGTLMIMKSLLDVALRLITVKEIA